MSSRLTILQLQQLKSIMQKMLAEASAANWSELSRLDGERRVVLDYPENAREMNALAAPRAAISSGQRPLSLEPTVHQPETTNVSAFSQTDDSHAADGPSDDNYRRLSKELMELDASIKKTIEDAREVLLNESRVIRAQVSAKKGYEKTSNMKSRSYG